MVLGGFTRLSDRLPPARAAMMLVLAGPELAGHVHADVRAQADTAASQACSYACRRLPRLRDHAGAHVAGYSAHRKGLLPALIGLRHDEGVFHGVTHAGQRTVLAGAPVMEILVARGGDTELN